MLHIRKETLKGWHADGFKTVCFGIIALHTIGIVFAYFTMLGVVKDDGRHTSSSWTYNSFSGKVPDSTSSAEIVSSYPVFAKYHIANDQCEVGDLQVLAVTFLGFLTVASVVYVAESRTQAAYVIPVTVMLFFFHHTVANTLLTLVDCWQRPFPEFNCSTDFELETPPYTASFESRQLSLPDAWNLLKADDVADLKCSRLAVVPASNFTGVKQLSAAGVQQWIPVTMPCDSVLDVQQSCVHVLQRLGPQCTACVGISVSCEPAIVKYLGILGDGRRAIASHGTVIRFLCGLQYAQPAVFAAVMLPVLLLDRLFGKLLAATNDDMNRGFWRVIVLRFVAVKISNENEPV